MASVDQEAIDRAVHLSMLKRGAGAGTVLGGANGDGTGALAVARLNDDTAPLSPTTSAGGSSAAFEAFANGVRVRPTVASKADEVMRAHGSSSLAPPVRLPAPGRHDEPAATVEAAAGMAAAAAHLPTPAPTPTPAPAPAPAPSDRSRGGDRRGRSLGGGVSGGSGAPAAGSAAPGGAAAWSGGCAPPRSAQSHRARSSGFDSSTRRSLGYALGGGGGGGGGGGLGGTSPSGRLRRGGGARASPTPTPGSRLGSRLPVTSEVPPSALRAPPAATARQLGYAPGSSRAPKAVVSSSSSSSGMGGGGEGGVSVTAAVAYRVSGLHTATVREAASFSIEVLDEASGERMHRLGEEFFVQVRGVARVRARVVDAGGGLYTVTWRPPVSGHYSIAIHSFGHMLPGSPFAVVATTPEPHASRCFVRGAALRQAAALEAQTFEVGFRDKLGTLTHAVDLDVFIEPVPPGSPRSPGWKPPPPPSSAGGPISAAAAAYGAWCGDALDGDGLGALDGCSGGEASSPIFNELSAAFTSAADGAMRAAAAEAASASASAAVAAAAAGGGAAGAGGGADGAALGAPQHWLGQDDRDRPTPPVGDTAQLPKGMPTTESPPAAATRRSSMGPAGVGSAGVGPAGVGSAGAASAGQSPPASAGHRRGSPSASGGARGAAWRRALAAVAVGLEAAAAVGGPEGEPTAHAPGASGGGDAATSEAAATDGQYTRRQRVLRVKVGDKPLAVHAAYDIDSEILGRVLPRTIVTVIEERVAADRVRASIALDHFAREGVMERGLTFSARERHPTARPHARVGFSARGGFSSREGARSSTATAMPTAAPAAAPTTPTIAAAAASTPVGAPRVALAASAAIAQPSPAQSAVAEATRVGAAAGVGPRHELSRVTAGPTAAAAAASGDQTLRNIGSPKGGRTERYFAPANRVGWITLRKLDADSGRWLTFVSSRLRLDRGSRQRHEQSWSRLHASQEADERRRILGRPSAVARKGDAERDEAAAQATQQERLTLALKSLQSAAAGATDDAAGGGRADRMDDPSGFAYGGVWPGVLHAHGKLHEVHRVSYSVARSGAYLLHVRLHQKAASLPGSPFLLDVAPGAAHAPSISLPIERLLGPAGAPIDALIQLADRAGNHCRSSEIEVGRGGVLQKRQQAAVSCIVTDSSECDARCEDQQDGTYLLSWTATRAGTYETHVKVNGSHIAGSPARVRVTASRLVLSKTTVTGPGLKDAGPQGGGPVVDQPRQVFIQCFDEFNNVASAPDDRFRFGCTLLSQKEAKGSGAKALPAFEHSRVEWLEAEQSYLLEYTPERAGILMLFVWADPEGRGARLELIPAPISLSVDPSSGKTLSAADAEAEGARRGAADAIHNAPGDYAVARDVFEECQERWGFCTVDGFASEATTMLPRYWAAEMSGPAEAADAFKQAWSVDERVWAHPPVGLMPELVAFLKRADRLAEAIVVVPVRKSMQWYRELSAIADGTQKYRAGKLKRVAADSPERIGEWPLMVFHVPAREDASATDGAGEREARIERRRSVFPPNRRGSFPSVPSGPQLLRS